MDRPCPAELVGLMESRPEHLTFHFSASCMPGLQNMRAVMTQGKCTHRFLDTCPSGEVAPISSPWMAGGVEWVESQNFSGHWLMAQVICFPKLVARNLLESQEKQTDLNYLKTDGLVSRSFQLDNQPIHSYFRQPKPSIMDVLGKFSRGQIAWNMGDYENTDQRNSRGATLVKQAKETLPTASRPPKLPMPPKKEV